MNVEDSMLHTKVCMVSGSYPPMDDGVAEYTQRLLHAIKQDFGNIRLITTENNGLKREREDGVFDIVGKWSFLALPGIIRHIKARKPNIVHIQYPTHGYGRNPAANFIPMILRIVSPKTRLISTIHEFSTRSLKGKSRLLISVIPSHRVIVVDQKYEKAIHKFWPFANGRLVYIPVGSNIPVPLKPGKTVVSRLRISLGIEEDDLVICYFGAVRRGKGIQLLLKVFHKLLQRHSETKMLFLGRIFQNYYQESVKTLVDSMQLNSNVIFTGMCEQSEICQYFALASMCVLPFEDGVSTKRTSFMAALQHDLPTITTEGELLPEGLVDHENVILTKCGDGEMLYSKIVELMENESLQNRLRENASKVLEHYSWNSIAERTMKVYRSLAR